MKELSFNFPNTVELAFGDDFGKISKTGQIKVVSKSQPVIVLQEGQEIIQEWLQSITTTINNDKLSLDILLAEDEPTDREKLCEKINVGITLIIDTLWYENEAVKSAIETLNVPYIRVDVSISPILAFLDAFLDSRNTTDVAIIFDRNEYMEQALYYWIGSSRLRLIIAEKLDQIAAQRLNEVRPIPSSYAVIGSAENITDILKVAIEENVMFRPDRWLLLFSDFSYKTFDVDILQTRTIHRLSIDEITCCNVLNMQDCTCPANFNMQKELFTKIIENTIEALQKLSRTRGITKNVICADNAEYDPVVRDAINAELRKALTESYRGLQFVDGVYRMKTFGTVKVINGSGNVENAGRYNTDDGFALERGHKMQPVRKFLRIGTAYAIPWSYTEINPFTGETEWTGYCLDFAHRLSEHMDFDYEIVIPRNGTFGKKDAFGDWDGVVGDLAHGETDIAIAALTMTADREEVVDFVPPYFEQSGISIVMRKPVRKTSLFKFMTVLKLEVWMSIVAALVVTGFMVWFLDKYSPYSAKNNKEAYPYPCRDFTLKESFWFALTSFTPQGGGEAPKALSGRTLVAAYWLFVVLMLATFTANLAAFLTVERMQTPVQSLEQLARQSRINYTVVKESATHKYFINMKFAEDTLYRLWKELTLNVSTDDTRYRVWDYPIREQYGHILLSINDSMPLPDADAGFAKVDAQLDADFAFIHDSSEIKYEITRNCNFTEVGEVFAEKPYAVAVQQGSHMQDDISRAILDMQKERYFEYLHSKYWNHSRKGDCPNTDDTEGITLESLGGVFIATLFGLALALITLAGEVMYYRRKAAVVPVRKEVKSRKEGKKPPKAPYTIGDKIPNAKLMEQKMVTIGTEFKPVKGHKAQGYPAGTLYPRARNRLPHVN